MWKHNNIAKRQYWIKSAAWGWNNHKEILSEAFKDCPN